MKKPAGKRIKDATSSLLPALMVIFSLPVMSLSLLLTFVLFSLIWMARMTAYSAMADRMAARQSRIQLTRADEADVSGRGVWFNLLLT